MNSSLLSLDELHVSFPRQGSHFRKRNVDGEDSHDLIGKVGLDDGKMNHQAVVRDLRKGDTLLSGDYFLTDGNRETEDVNRLPIINPASREQKRSSQQARKKVERGDFGGMGLEDLSTWDKAAMVNTRRREVNLGGNANLRNKSTPPRPCNYEEMVKKISTEEISCLENSTERFRDARFPQARDHYTDLHGQNRKLKLFHPPSSPKPELDVEEKVTKFIEKEFSMIKGQDTNSTGRRKYRALPESPGACEREIFNAKSLEARKSLDTSMTNLGKPVIIDGKENTEESLNHYDESTKRCKLRRSPRPRNSQDFGKFESDSIAETCVNNKPSKDSQNCRKLPTELNLNGTANSMQLEQKGFLTSSPKDISPRLSPKESDSSNQLWFGLSSKGHQVQELPLDLPEKVTRFIEMEFSIIKGETARLSQKQKYIVSTDVECSREKAAIVPNCLNSRKSEQSLSLLQRRGRMAKGSSLNLK